MLKYAFKAPWFFFLLTRTAAARAVRRWRLFSVLALLSTARSCALFLRGFRSILSCLLLLPILTSYLFVRMELGDFVIASDDKTHQVLAPSLTVSYVYYKKRKTKPTYKKNSRFLEDLQNDLLFIESHTSDL